MPNIGPAELLFIVLLVTGAGLVAFLATRSNRPAREPQARDYYQTARAPREPDYYHQPVDPMSCPRCNTELTYVGTKKFHEGTRAWGFALGDLGELFVNRESFDVYLCGRCGRVELFVDGIGEEFRPH